MKTTVERLEPTKVKLTIEVEPREVSKAFDAAAREIAQQVQLPGFRKGRVPRKLLESKVGKGAIAQQAIEPAVSRYYADAVQAEELDVVANPEIDLQTFTEEEGCVFEATVEVRPELEVPDHEGIDVTYPDWDVSDEEVQERIDELRDRFSELEEVDRPAHVGDYVTIDLEVVKGGEPIEDAAVEDALYEVGSGGVTPQLDQELAGAVAGQSLTYVDELPEDYPVHGGEPAEFTVTVKDVREKQLPELDDDFAITASEFETLEELEEDIRTDLRRRKVAAARQELRGQVLEAYVALVGEVPLPDAMVEGEVQSHLEQLESQAERYGLELEELLEVQGLELDAYTEDLREQARGSVRARLVLEALAEKIEIEVDSVDLSDEIQRHAEQRGVEPGVIARIVNEHGTAGVLVGDVIRRKALDALVEAADVTGGPGEADLRELGFIGEDEDADDLGPAAPGTGEVPDPGAGTEPHPPSLGGEEPPLDAVEGPGEEDPADESPDDEPEVEPEARRGDEGETPPPDEG
jgi:trigger factor